MLIPDILANAGGVTVSYYEWVQDQYSFFWSESRINQTLEDTMGDAFHKGAPDGTALRHRHAHRRLHPGDRSRGGSDAGARDIPVRRILECGDLSPLFLVRESREKNKAVTSHRTPN